MDEAQVRAPERVRSDFREGSYVDWASTLAGAVVAGALLFMLLTFGSGVGLSMLSPWQGASVAASAIAIVAAAWLVFAHLLSFGIGGYLAGRMRRPWADAGAEEVRFRDGAHGALVWGIGVVLGGVILASAAGSTIRAGAQGAGAAVASSQFQAGGVAMASLDALFRPAERFPETTSPAEIRAEAARILATALSRGDLAPADRSYLAQLVAQRTGLAPRAAEERITQVINEARSAADQTRRAGVVAAFFTAASLLVALSMAWSAAVLGGRHRQEGIVWRGFSRLGTPRQRG